jgi:hypothetical protein
MRFYVHGAVGGLKMQALLGKDRHLGFGSRSILMVTSEQKL